MRITTSQKAVKFWGQQIQSKLCNSTENRMAENVDSWSVAQPSRTRELGGESVYLESIRKKRGWQLHALQFVQTQVWGQRLRPQWRPRVGEGFQVRDWVDRGKLKKVIPYKSVHWIFIKMLSDMEVAPHRQNPNEQQFFSPKTFPNLMERTTYFDGMVVLTDTYSMMHLIIFFFSLARRCWTGIIEVSWKLYIKKNIWPSESNGNISEQHFEPGVW